MATIGYTAPRLVGNPNNKEPKPFLVLPTQNAAWRFGDLVVNAVTGAITNPPSVASGGLVGQPAPGATGASAVTITNSAVAGAPAQSYFIEVTYTGASAESVVSQIFLQNCPAGNVPSINVAASGAPAAATGFNAYVGLTPTAFYKQNASPSTLGTPVVLTYPLTNYQGGNRAATNLSSGILGLAQCSSDASFFGGPGGSIVAGQNSSQLGTTNTMSPLTPNEAIFNYVTGLGFGQLVEMNLNQNTALTLGLLSTTAGITYDAATGIPTIDPTQSNKIFTITDFRQGVYIGPTASGTFGDLGARVVGYFNSGLLNQ